MMTKRSLLLSCTVAASAIAGCATPKMVSPVVETNGTAHITPAATVADNKPATDPGANPLAADPNKNVDNSNDNALDKSKSMHISAKDGGVYVSDDGLLKAVFPPGSLSQDADVKLVRVDTGNLKNTDVFLNGIRYQWDLGNAYIMPNTKVTVTSKADDRLVPALKAMYTDFTMDRYSLSKDDKGNYNVTMSYAGTIKAPAPLQPGEKGEDSVTRGTMQEGSFPITVSGSSAFKQDSRIEAFCNYQPPPKRASYGNFCTHVTWDSDSVSGLKGTNAYAPDPSDPSKDSRVYVVFSTNFVNAPLPPEYNITDTIPAVKGRDEVDTDQFGNVLGSIPTDYQDVVAQANDKKARGSAVYIDGSASPAAPAIWTGHGLFGGYAKTSAAIQHVKLLDPVSAQAAQEIVKQTNVTLPASNGGNYITGGHPFNGDCNCGGYVTQDDGPVIKYTNIFTDASGNAITQALQSYNSTNCSAGICAGGDVHFYLFAQAHTRYPDQATNAERLITPSLYGPMSDRADSAQGGCLQLTTPKYSPYIHLNLTDDKAVAYHGSITMEYTLNGTPHTQTWTVDNKNGAEVDEAFFMPDITDDNDWTLAIQKIYTTNGTEPAENLKMVADQTSLRKYDSFALRRNNVYNLTLNMVLNEAK